MKLKSSLLSTLYVSPLNFITEMFHLFATDEEGTYIWYCLDTSWCSWTKHLQVKVDSFQVNWLKFSSIWKCSCKLQLEWSIKRHRSSSLVSATCCIYHGIDLSARSYVHFVYRHNHLIIIISFIMALYWKFQHAPLCRVFTNPVTYAIRNFSIVATLIHAHRIIIM